MSIPVTITSDFICPWCLIGERRLAAEIAALPQDVSVELRWQPFELNPEMATEGMNRKIYRSMKFGSWERSRMLDAQTIAAARGDGIAFDYDAVERTPNTFQAHRLMRFAERQGCAGKLGPALLSAYFERGRDIGDPAVLAEIAGEQGLNRDLIAEFLASEAEGDAVRMAEHDLHARGINSVPLFDIGGQIISGAQSRAVFADALRGAWALSASPDADSEAACADGLCPAA